MSGKVQKRKINAIKNDKLNIGTENEQIENLIEIRDIEQYQIDSIEEKKNSSQDKNSEVKENVKKDEVNDDDDDENKPLIINEKLIKIFNNISKNIEKDPNKNIVEIYDNYHEKKVNKIEIKKN